MPVTLSTLPTAPVAVSSLSLAVSFGSLAISLGSLIVAIFAIKVSGPRMTYDCFLVSYHESGPWHLVVDAANGGRSAITLNILGVEQVIHNYSGQSSSRTTVQPKWEGPSLPHRLEGHTSAMWWAPGDKLYGDLKPVYGDLARVVIKSGKRIVRVPVKSAPRSWPGRQFDIKGLD